MSSERSGVKAIGWRYYSGSDLDFYWPWILFGLLWIAASLWLAGSFSGKPSEGPPIETVAVSGTALPIDCPPLALGGPPSLMGIGAAVEAAAGDGDGSTAAVSLDGCTLVADALAGWMMMADGRRGDVEPDSERAIGKIDRSWQEAYLCSLTPSWGEYRPVIGYIVAAGVIEPCAGGRWAASLPLVRGTGWSVELAQFLTFVLIVVPIALLIVGMGRSWQTRAAFRWLYQSQHG